jgi:diacylglycerol kinase family enzyme
VVRDGQEPQVPDRTREAVEAGADPLFVWGGDGTMQRCIDTVAEVTVRNRDPALTVVGNLVVRGSEEATWQDGERTR